MTAFSGIQSVAILCCVSCSLNFFSYVSARNVNLLAFYLLQSVGLKYVGII